LKIGWKKFDDNSSQIPTKFLPDIHAKYTDIDDFPTTYNIQNISEQTIESLSPIKFFHLLFPVDFIDDITIQTNLYYEQEKKKYFKKNKKLSFSFLKKSKTTNNDIKIYLGLCLWMGMISNKDYKGISILINR